MSLTEFLLARIAEDEAAAGHADWAMQGEWFTTADDKVDEYVRRLSPARVLAECEAKRRIVELHTPVDEDPDGWCNHCDGDGWPCGTMAALASVYVDHPDYREDWKP